MGEGRRASKGEVEEQNSMERGKRGGMSATQNHSPPCTLLNKYRANIYRFPSPFFSLTFPFFPISYFPLTCFSLLIFSFTLLFLLIIVFLFPLLSSHSSPSCASSFPSLFQSFFPSRLRFITNRLPFLFDLLALNSCLQEISIFTWCLRD